MKAPGAVFTRCQKVQFFREVIKFLLSLLLNMSRAEARGGEYGARKISVRSVSKPNVELKTSFHNVED